MDPSKSQNSIANLVDIESKKDGGGGGISGGLNGGGNGFTNLAYNLDQSNGLPPNGTSTTYAEEELEGYHSNGRTDPVPDSDRTNYVQTLMHLLNGFIGSGILSMPMAFRDGGIVLASALNPVIGVMSCYCIHLLLSINRFAMKKTNTNAPYDYHELARYAFQFGPARLRPYANTASIVVLSVIVATQIGGCCVYFTFIATNLEKFLINMVGRDRAPRKELCLAIVLPCAIAINFIRNIRHLTFFSTVSNVAQVTGLVIIFYNLFSRPIEDISALPAVGQKIPQFFVSTLFIYEGISVSMSLYKAIRDPRQFHKPLGVLNVGLCIIIAFYFSIGFFGYVQYGDKIQGTITVNLPAEPMYDAVQLLYSLAVLLTYPIILYVPIQILWPMLRLKAARWLKVKSLASNGGEEKEGAVVSRADRLKILAAELAFRTALVLSTYVLAAVIPKLELIISLVGAVTSSTVTVTIPAVLHVVCFWNQRKGAAWWVLVLSNLSLFTIGVLGLGFGFYFSLIDIINSYKNSNPDDDLGRLLWSNGTLTGAALVQQPWLESLT